MEASPRKAMPSTYNGIGTHYYGEKNCEVRVAECRFCGHTVDLKTYDTRLWFVIFFIPVLPIGRKRIIDYCPSCTRHYAVEADKWETAKQLNISGALDEFRANPTPEAAIEAHQQLLAYHDMTQAAEFRQAIAVKFADNAKVQTHLGLSLADLGKHEEAIGCFQRALDLRPDLPEARVGLAGAHMRAWRLNEARKLLDFLEKPGAVQLYSLEPLEQLANSYQSQERHPEALDLYSKLLQAIPEAAKHKGFRQRVEKSEKAIGRAQSESLLPKLKFSWREAFSFKPSINSSPGQFRFTVRGLTFAAGAVAVVVIIFALVNANIRRHRTIYVVNGLKGPISFSLPGATAIKIVAGVEELKIPEGRYHAKVSGALQKEIDFEIRAAGYFSRFFDKPMWIIDPGGASLFVRRDATYSARNPRPPITTFHYGRDFYQFSGISHPFQELPKSVYLKRSEERTHTQIERFKDPLVNVYYYLLSDGRRGDALALAEWRLRVHPDEEAMLEAYNRQAVKDKQTARAEKFLRAGLTNRPVQIEWHRAYQQVSRKTGRETQLNEEYEKMLASDPTNSALLYLRGRAFTNETGGEAWFERARQADASNPYPHYALGYGKLVMADWAGARPLLARACELKPGDEMFRYWFTLTRLALGEFATLERELRERLKRDPLDVYAAMQLVEALSAAGKKSEAEQVASEFDRSIILRARDSAAELSKLVRRSLLYACGDFATLEKHSAGDKSGAGRNALFYALVEQGRLAEAEKIHPEEDYAFEDNYQLLALSVAWRRAGDTQKADALLQRAIKEFEAGDRDMREAAALLRSKEPPSREAFDALKALPKSKALLATALALQHPARAADFAVTARKLNVDRSYPYHLVQRITATIQ